MHFKKWNFKQNTSNRDWKTPLVTALVTAVTTTLFSYFLFIKQFESNIDFKISERQVDIVYEIIQKSSSIEDNISKVCQYYYKYDLLANYWRDSLKASQLKYTEGEKIKAIIEKEYPREFYALTYSDSLISQLNNKLYLAQIFFKSKKLTPLLHKYFDINNPLKRHSIYDSIFTHYFSRNNTSFENVNLYPISDSIMNRYHNIMGDIILEMTDELSKYRIL